LKTFLYRSCLLRQNAVPYTDMMHQTVTFCRVLHWYPPIQCARISSVLLRTLWLISSVTSSLKHTWKYFWVLGL
jgi:hypothetical protein